MLKDFRLWRREEWSAGFGGNPTRNGGVGVKEARGERKQTALCEVTGQNSRALVIDRVATDKTEEVRENPGFLV